MAPAPTPDPRSSRRLRAVAIVPARLESRRLPRKMLLSETGAPLFVHTVRNVERCPAIERVLVATDSPEIAALARRHGIDARMTRSDHASGTERVAEALATLGAACEIVVNVQGDEPEVDPDDLAALVAAFREPGIDAATLCGRFERADEACAPGVVKVVRAANGDALYFSRSVIPYCAGDSAAAYARDDAPPWLDSVRRHIGVYAFRPDALRAFVALPRGALEGLENLEQLRWLEAGKRMRVVEARHVPLGIDTRLDYDAFVQRVAGERTSARASGGARPTG